MGSCPRNSGSGKAVVIHAMHQMRAAGMTHATVANASTNEASRELYKACGFEPRYLIDDYSKPIQHGMHDTRPNPEHKMQW